MWVMNGKDIPHSLESRCFLSLLYFWILHQFVYISCCLHSTVFNQCFFYYSVEPHIIHLIVSCTWLEANKNEGRSILNRLPWWDFGSSENTNKNCKISFKFLNQDLNKGNKVREITKRHKDHNSPYCKEKCDQSLDIEHFAQLFVSNHENIHTKNVNVFNISFYIILH